MATCRRGCSVVDRRRQCPVYAPDIREWRKLAPSWARGADTLNSTPLAHRHDCPEPRAPCRSASSCRTPWSQSCVVYKRPCQLPPRAPGPGAIRAAGLEPPRAQSANLHRRGSGVRLLPRVLRTFKSMGGGVCAPLCSAPADPPRPHCEKSTAVCAHS